MNLKNIIIIIVSLLIILYASFGTIQREKVVRNILNAPIELNDTEYTDESLEEFQLYTPKCSNITLDKCYNSVQCGLSLDENKNLYCQEGGLKGPWKYPTNTWIYNGKCWGKGCEGVMPYLNNLPNNYYDPNNFISPYNIGYKLSI